MVEADLLRPDYCIVCNKPIDDLDRADIRIKCGDPGVAQTETHFQQKSYFRCTNPQCLSGSTFPRFSSLVYHKQCVPHCVWNGLCGVCKPGIPAKRGRAGSLSSSPASEREGRSLPRGESGREGDLEERRGVKRAASRALRSSPSSSGQPGQTPGEDESRSSPKKRKAGSARAKAGNSRGSEVSFERISESEAMRSVKRLLKELYETGIAEEVPILTSVKSGLKNGAAVGAASGVNGSGSRRSRSAIARCSARWWRFWSGTSGAEAGLRGSVEAVRDFAASLRSLLQRKLERHFAETSFEALVGREMEGRRGGRGQTQRRTWERRGEKRWRRCEACCGVQRTRFCAESSRRECLGSLEERGRRKRRW